MRQNTHERTIGSWSVLIVVGVLVGTMPATASNTPVVASEEDALEPARVHVRRLLNEAKYSEAQTVAEELFGKTVTKYGQGSLQAVEVLDLIVVARAQGGKLREPETLALARKAIRLRESLLGPEHTDVARGLNNLGILLSDLGEYQEAEEYLERALRIREKGLGDEHPDVAQSLHSLASLLTLTGQYDRAKPLFERALDIREKRFGAESPTVAHTLGNLANLLVNLGDFSNAKTLQERTLTIYESEWGPEHPNVAAALHNLATIYYHMGDYAGATQLFERALVMRETVLGSEHPVVTESMLGLGVQYVIMGDYVRGKRLFEAAVSIQERTLGPAHPALGPSLHNLGSICGEMGDYTQAISTLERAFSVTRAALGEEHPDLALILHSLSTVYAQNGEEEKALSLLERALGIQERTLGPEHPEVANSLQYLATVLSRMGERDRAKYLVSRAVGIQEKALGSDHPDLANSLTQLGLLLGESGEINEALGALQRAKEIRRRTVGSRHPQFGRSCVALAQVYAMLGDRMASIDEALAGEQVERAHLRITLRALPENQALRLASVRRLGLDLALSMLASAEESPETREVSQRIWDAMIRSRAMVLDEMAMRHRAVAEASYPEVDRLYLRLVSATNRLANLVVRGREDRSPNLYRKLLDDAQREREEAEQALAERSAAFRSQLAESRVGLKEVQQVLPESSALVSFVAYDRYNLAVTKSSSKNPSSSGGIQRVPGIDETPVPSYLAFIGWSGREEVVAINIGRQDEIDSLVYRWRDEVGRRPDLDGGQLAGAEARYRNVATALRRRIWDPIAGHVEEAKSIFIVPDGMLNLVNVAVLPIRKSEYLVQERGLVLHYLSTERDLVSSAASQRRGEGLLAIGGPDFGDANSEADPSRSNKLGKPSAAAGPRSSTPQVQGTGASIEADPPTSGEEVGALTLVGTAAPAAASQKTGEETVNTFRGERAACGDFQQMYFESLPASLAEVEDIVSLWRKDIRSGGMRRSRVRNGPSPSLRLSGAAATETAFKMHASGRRVLHLATHGFFLGKACPSALQASSQGQRVGLGREEALPPLAGENPLLLSGLAFSGANHRAARGPKGDDGILTAEEIAAMDLSGVEWAVLSGCDTGVGEIQKSEGVFGLRRAFQVAGAGTVIMSLWSVQDDVAREWMRNLYQTRLAGFPTAEAVKKASLRTMDSLRRSGIPPHPYYWGPFVGVGDWR